MIPNNQQRLRVPGPTPVPDEVARAGAAPMVNHRGPEFAASMTEVARLIAPFLGTERDVLLLTGSGTAGLEAAVVNAFSPGDQVLAATCGVFGDRFASIAEAFGASISSLHAEWGQAISPPALEEAVLAMPDLKGVLLTHNETSTGVTNDVEALARTVRRCAPHALILVDGVSSIGAMPFRMDEWDVDIALTGSQKAWMCPPGLAMIAMSERGWRAQRQATMPRYYWDLAKARKNSEKRTTPFTPAVGIVHALETALGLMTAEGQDNIYARHRRIGGRVREGIARLGLDLFADPAVASNTVTAVRIPPGLETTLVRRLREEQGIVVGSGQDWLKGRIFRIGHMGWVDDDTVESVLEAVRAILQDSRLDEAV